MTSNYLFRIEKAAENEGEILGYEWIEVLAIEPWALGRRPASYGDWCDRTISVEYVCLTDLGLVRIGSEDFWTALEDLREYESEAAVAGGAAVVIRAGDRSVVQVGSTTVGGVHTGDQVAPLGFPLSDELVHELAELRAALHDQTKDHGNLETDVAIGALAEAEDAARNGNERRLVASLKKVGVGVASTARELGVEVAAAAITKAGGL